MNELQQLRKWIYRSYAESVGLDPNARYVHGTPLRPVVPLDAARGGLFVIGAYPPASTRSKAFAMSRWATISVLSSANAGSMVRVSENNRQQLSWQNCFWHQWESPGITAGSRIS